MDTFSELRDELYQRSEVRKNSCLVCGNSKKDILEAESEFDRHIKFEHNIWDYVYFFSYVLTKKDIDSTIPEEEAERNIKDSKTDFLPLKSSLYLANLKLDEESSGEAQSLQILAQLDAKVEKIHQTLKKGALHKSVSEDGFEKSMQ